MSRRPSEGSPPPQLSPTEASAQRLAPFVREWEPTNHDPRDWPQHAPRIAKRDDPWRGHRFFRDLMAMQEERRVLHEARVAGEKDGSGGEAI